MTRGYFMKNGAVNFIKHIRNMITASGKKRVIYALANIVIMALAVAAAAGIKALATAMNGGELNFIAAIVGIIICFALGVFCFLQGFIAQIALVFISGAGIANPEERGGNIAAFIISFLTTAGLVAAAIVILKVI